MVTVLSNQISYHQTSATQRTRKKRKWNSLEREQEAARKVEEDKLMSMMDEVINIMATQSERRRSCFKKGAKSLKIPYFFFRHLITILESTGGLSAQFWPTCVSQRVAPKEEDGGDTGNTSAGPKKIQGEASGDVSFTGRTENCADDSIRTGGQEAWMYVVQAFAVLFHY
jgi:hypothetical protein